MESCSVLRATIQMIVRASQMKYTREIIATEVWPINSATVMRRLHSKLPSFRMHVEPCKRTSRPPDSVLSSPVQVSAALRSLSTGDGVR